MRILARFEKWNEKIKYYENNIINNNIKIFKLLLCTEIEA